MRASPRPPGGRGDAEEDVGDQEDGAEHPEGETTGADQKDG